MFFFFLFFSSSFLRSWPCFPDASPLSWLKRKVLRSPLYGAASARLVRGSRTCQVFEPPIHNVVLDLHDPHFISKVVAGVNQHGQIFAAPANSANSEYKYVGEPGFELGGMTD